MIKLGDKLSFPTGRQYGKDQVLDCEIVEIKNDDYFNEAIYTIKVIDEARHMKILVQSTEFCGENILNLYDAGLYHNAQI